MKRDHLHDVNFHFYFFIFIFCPFSQYVYAFLIQVSF